MPWTTTNTAKGDNKLYSDAKGVVPSLDLRFASQKNLNDYMTGQNLITFSRPVGANQSPGTYVDENGIIQLSTADTPRFDHNPATGESLGLLIEESRINRVLLSIPPATSSTGWSVVNATGTANAISAPDGTLSATEYSIINSDPSTKRIFSWPIQNQPVINRTVSVFAKTGTANELYMTGINAAGTIVINLNTGVVTTNTSESTVTTEEYLNGWWRIVLTQNSGNALLYTALPSGQSGTFYLWGGQVEEGSFATSYIPTTGTALTRSADDASITGSNFSSWFVQNNGSFYCKADLQSPASSGQSPIFSVDSSGANYRVASRRATLGVRNSSSGTDGIDITNFSVWNGEVKEFALTWVANDCALVDSGTLIGTDTTTLNPLSTVNQLLIGNVNVGGFLSRMGGHISRLTYFPDRLENSVLQAITQ